MGDLLKRLTLTEVGTDRFRARSVQGLPRVYGGEAAAQALMAANNTVERDRYPHSVHCQYILAGDPSAPLEYVVERTRDGRSFSTRRVACEQGGVAIFTAAISYHSEEDGVEHQLPMPETAPPELLMTLAEAEAADVPGRAWIPWGAEQTEYELRTVPPDLHDPFGRRLFWGRFRLDDDVDPWLQGALALYASDFTMIASMRVPHEPDFRKIHHMSTLNHTVYLHEPFDSTAWHLIDHFSPRATRGRGLSISHVYTRDGVLVATGVQEGLARLPR